MRRLEKLSKRAPNQRTAGGLPGCGRAARDGLRRLGQDLPPDPHRRPGAQRLQAEGLLPSRGRDRLQRQPHAIDDPAAPRKALRAHPAGPGRGRRRHGGPRPDLATGRGDEGVRGEERSAIAGRSGGHRRQRHRPHLRRARPGAEAGRDRGARRPCPHERRRRRRRRGDPRRLSQSSQQPPGQQRRGRQRRRLRHHGLPLQLRNEHVAAQGEQRPPATEARCT